MPGFRTGARLLDATWGHIVCVWQAQGWAASLRVGSKEGEKGGAYDSEAVQLALGHLHAPLALERHGRFALRCVRCAAHVHSPRRLRRGV